MEAQRISKAKSERTNRTTIRIIVPIVSLVWILYPVEYPQAGHLAVVEGIRCPHFGHFIMFIVRFPFRSVPKTLSLSLYNVTIIP